MQGVTETSKKVSSNPKQPTSPWKFVNVRSWGPGSVSLKVKAASLFKDPLWDSPREPLLLKANCFKVLPMLKVAILNAEFGFEERIRTVIAREVLVSPDGGGMLIVMI